MGVRKVLLAGLVVIMAGIAAPATAAPASTGSHHLLRHAHRPAVHARPAVKKPHAAVWTLGEFVKGKIHKLPAGASFYGRSTQASLLLSQNYENTNGFKWTINRDFYCAASTFQGKVKSNGVATPEITIESITGALNRGSACTEEARRHPFEKQEGEFTPWRKGYVRLKGLPITLSLQPPQEGFNEAVLTPTSLFEVEVESFEGSIVCKYFQIRKITESLGAREPGDAQQLAVGNFATGLSPETFNSQCLEGASVGFDISGFVGQYGPALFDSYK